MAETIQSIEPATGALLWQGESGDVDAEVTLAASRWAEWAMQPVSNRAETLRRFANAVRADEDAFADLIARETGRPLWDAREEIAAVIARVEQAIAAFAERTGQKRLNAALGGTQAVRHRPHGVIAVIGTSATPVQAACAQLIPALLAGNGVVFKPSQQTPASGAKLVATLQAAGVPDGLVRCLHGGPSNGKALAAHPGVRGVLFTGSAQSGLAIAQMIGGNPEKIVALEMGGNNPLVLWDTPDLAAAAAIIVQSAFLSAGQRCTAARRLIVKTDLVAPLMPVLLDLVDRLIIDHPHADPAPYCGPMIDMAAADALTESFLYLMSHGGKPVRHIQRPKPGLPFVTPGIIDVTAMDRRPDVELFGPLLQIVQAATFDEALRAASATRYGLCAALIGGSPAQYDRFWAQVRAGTVNWNRPTTAASGNAPFGGIGLSGNHRAGGSYAADHCAWPVASLEAEQPRGTIGIGLRPAAAIVADR